jgi:hypothetical protein
MASSTKSALALLLLALQVISLQAKNFLQPRSTMTHQQMVEKQLIKSMSHLASSLRKHLLESETMVPLGRPHFADAARELLKREARRLPAGPHANLLQNYASWAPDVMLVMPPDFDKNAEADTRLMKIPSSAAGSPFGRTISEETVIRSDGKNLVKETTHCSNGDCETRGQVIGSTPKKAIAESQDDKLESLSGLHSDMRGLSTNMNQLGDLVGKNMAKNILGKIFNKALEDSDLMAESHVESPSESKMTGHHHVARRHHFPGFMRDHDQAGSKSPLEDALHGLVNTGLDSGSRHPFGPLKTSDVMEDTLASVEASGIKDRLKKASGIKTTDGQSRKEQEFDAGWDLGQKLAEKIIGSIVEPSKDKALQESSSPPLADGKTSDGLFDFSGSRTDRGSEQHHALGKKMDPFQNAAAQMGTALGKDLANAILGSVIDKKGADNRAHSFNTDQDQSLDQSQKIKKLMEKIDQEHDSVSQAKEVQDAMDSQDEHLSAPATAASVTSDATVTSVKDGKRITKERICEHGHCKTVITTEDLDLDAPAAEKSQESDSIARDLHNELQQVFSPLESMQ